MAVEFTMTLNQLAACTNCVAIVLAINNTRLESNPDLMKQGGVADYIRDLNSTMARLCEILGQDEEKLRTMGVDAATAITNTFRQDKSKPNVPPLRGDGTIH